MKKQEKPFNIDELAFRLINILIANTQHPTMVAAKMVAILAAYEGFDENDLSTIIVAQAKILKATKTIQDSDVSHFYQDLKAKAIAATAANKVH